MLGLSEEARRRRIGMGITGVVLFLVLVYIGSGGLHVWQLPSKATTALPPLADGLVGGVFVAGAASAAIATWRKHIDPKKAWVVAAGALVAGQALLVTLVAIGDVPPRGSVTFALLLAVALAGLLAVTAPLLGLVRVAHVTDDGVVIGLGMGLLAASHLLLQFPLSPTPAALMQLTIGALAATHVAAVALVLGPRSVPAATSALVVATVLVVEIGQLVSVLDLTGTAWDTAASLGRAAAGATWICLALVSVRRGLEDDRRRLNTSSTSWWPRPANSASDSTSCAAQWPAWCPGPSCSTAATYLPTSATACGARCAVSSTAWTGCSRARSTTPPTSTSTRRSP
jgi:hypothetical protein